MPDDWELDDWEEDGFDEDVWDADAEDPEDGSGDPGDDEEELDGGFDGGWGDVHALDDLDTLDDLGTAEGGGGIDLGRGSTVGSGGTGMTWSSWDVDAAIWAVGREGLLLRDFHVRQKRVRSTG